MPFYSDQGIRGFRLVDGEVVIGVGEQDADLIFPPLTHFSHQENALNPVYAKTEVSAMPKIALKSEMFNEIFQSSRRYGSIFCLSSCCQRP